MLPIRSVIVGCRLAHSQPAHLSCALTSIRFSLLCAAVALSGCASLIKPNLGPDPEVAKTYDQAPTLQNAIAVGTSMRERYSAKVEDQIAWERGIGIGLIGAATIGADLAMRSVGKSEILGLGLAGAALYASSNWLFSKPQQLIYAAGAGAVQCALDTVLPLQGPYQQQDVLQSKRDQIARTVLEVKRLKANVAPGAPGQPPNSLVRADAMIARANVVLTAADQALAVLKGAAGTLRSSLSAIQIQVTNAYITNAPSMEALVRSLETLIPAAPPKINTGSTAVASTVGVMRSAENEGPLVVKTAELENLITEVSLMIDAINASPAPNTLKQCNVDLKQAGLSMKLTPSELSITPDSKGTVTASAFVSGNVLPYSSDWIGVRPPSNQLDQKIGPTPRTITVTASPAAKTGTYQILILDEAKAQETILQVTILGETASSPQKQAAPVSAVDQRVKNLQQDLIDLGYGTVEVKGKKVTVAADGRMGSITTEAMRQFYINNGRDDVQEDAIPRESKRLFDDVENMIKDLKSRRTVET